MMQASFMCTALACVLCIEALAAMPLCHESRAFDDTLSLIHTSDDVRQLMAGTHIGGTVGFASERERNTTFPQLDCVQWDGAIQMITSSGTSKLMSLNVATGVYGDIYTLPPNPHGPNGCSVNPIDSVVYCLTKQGATGPYHLARVSPFALEYVAETGWAFNGAFSMSGAFYFVDDDNMKLYKIDNVANLASFANAADPSIPDVRSSPFPLVSNIFGGVADVVVIQDGGVDKYVVFFGGPNVGVISLADGMFKNLKSDLPEGTYGAGWNFRNEIFFSHNSGNGIYTIDVAELEKASGSTVITTKVGVSAATDSNDGLNCLTAESPFRTPSPTAAPIEISAHPAPGIASAASAGPLESVDPAPGGTASAKDDPHVRNLAGEAFDIKAPGEHVMFRLPSNLTQPPLIELRAMMFANLKPSCNLYVTSAALSGDWLDGRTIHIRALRRDTSGSNTAGVATIWPFALKVSQAEAVDASYWRPFANFTSSTTSGAASEVLTDNLAVAAVIRNEFGGRLEAQAFEFHLGKDKPGEKMARLIVAQASHQALSLEFAGIWQLGFREVGGVLGTEMHDKNIEKPTHACRDAKTAKGSSELLRETIQQPEPLLEASWL